MRETTEPRAWLVRSSRNAAYDQWMLDSGYTAVNLCKASELSPAFDLPAMRVQFAPEMPGKSDKAIGNYAAQLNAFVNRMAEKVLRCLLKHLETPPEKIWTRIPFKRVRLLEQAEG